MAMKKRLEHIIGRCISSGTDRKVGYTRDGIRVEYCNLQLPEYQLQPVVCMYLGKIVEVKTSYGWTTYHICRIKDPKMPVIC
jgi:hypothetical protein